MEAGWMSFAIFPRIKCLFFSRKGQYNLQLFRFFPNLTQSNGRPKIQLFDRQLFWIGWITWIAYMFLNFPVALILKDDFPTGGFYVA